MSGLVSSPPPRVQLCNARCCCNVRTAALVIALLEIIGCFIQICTSWFIISNWNPAEESKTQDQHVIIQFMFGKDFHYVNLAIYLIGLITLILLYVGVYRKLARFLLPHLIFQVVTILLFILAFGLTLWSVSRLNDRPDLLIPTIAYGCGHAISVVLEIYFLYIVSRCYLWLKKVAELREQLRSAPGGSAQIVAGTAPFGANSYNPATYGRGEHASVIVEQDLGSGYYYVAESVDPTDIELVDAVNTAEQQNQITGDSTQVKTVQ